MSRRHSAEKREINPDPKYGNLVVSKFMNSIMRAGKKSVAESIVYGAFEIIEGKTKQNPVSIFEQALDNVMPSIEVPLAARRRRDLSGAGRGSHHPPPGTRHPLDHLGRARAQ
jgi:ribosomal protein S7